MRVSSTADLTPTELAALRAMLDASYEGDFSDEDWGHTLGGTHFLVVDAGVVIGHASVVPRTLVVGNRALATGYVEAVATVHGRRGEGHGTALMRAATDLIGQRFEFGGLCTGSHGFYERLGWQRWRGPTFVRGDHGWTRTPEEDTTVMVLRTAGSGPIDLTERIACDWRDGDVW